MTDFGVYHDRFSESGRRVFERAVRESSNHQQNYASMGHLLKALLVEEAGSFHDTFANLRIEPPLTAEFLDMVIAGSPRHRGAGVRLSPQVTWLFRHGRKVARGEGREQIEAADLLEGFVRGLRAGAAWVGEREGQRIGLAFVPANEPHFFVIRL